MEDLVIVMKADSPSSGCKYVTTMVAKPRPKVRVGCNDSRITRDALRWITNERGLMFQRRPGENLQE
jgi:hypothetical protein